MNISISQGAELGGCPNFSEKAGNDLFCSLDTIESFSGKIKFYSLELSAESKMAAGGHIGKMKYLRITNDTILMGFWGQGIR